MFNINGKDFTIFGVCLIIFSTIFVASGLTILENEEVRGNFVYLEVEKYDSEGNFVEKRCIEDDLILRNFAYNMLLAGSGSDYLDAKSKFQMKKMDGGLITHSGYTMKWAITNAGAYIGEGTTAPAITDYALESEVMEELIIDRIYWTSGTQFNVTVDCLFLIDGTYAITEAGLSTALESGTYDVLMLRDTFPAINVNAGDTIVVRYYFLCNWS